MTGYPNPTQPCLHDVTWMSLATSRISSVADEQDRVFGRKFARSGRVPRQILAVSSAMRAAPILVAPASHNTRSF